MPSSTMSMCVQHIFYIKTIFSHIWAMCAYTYAIYICMCEYLCIYVMYMIVYKYMNVLHHKTTVIVFKSFISIIYKYFGYYSF